MLHDVNNTNDVSKTAQRIIETLHGQIEIGEHILRIDVNLGISLNPDHAVDAESMMRNALVALQKMRKEGTLGYRIFSEEMDENNHRRKEIEASLIESLTQNNDELYLVYQPIISAKKGTLHAVEALVRWQHPKLGNIPPSIFIPIAEETGFIVELGNWIMRKAFEEAKHWGNTKVCINVSPVQFRRADFIEQVQCAIAQTNIDSSRVELEVTEGVLIHDQETAAKTVKKLQRQGISIALDDFGTGYASIGALRQLDVDKLKIDQSFVMSLGQRKNSNSILSAIVALGNSLNLKMVAEGVETEEQQDLLVSMGVDYLQGYLLARPMSAKQISEMIKTRALRPSNSNRKEIALEGFSVKVQHPAGNFDLRAANKA